eukprot:GEMP01009142.1.p1 GENE.GEMP01009142.1~~GEMP01009142.1.p1  ORF type:complete len:938 (+),score=153.78 GEMP01009142.1:94-2814(+)
MTSLSSYSEADAPQSTKQSRDADDKLSSTDDQKPNDKPAKKPRTHFKKGHSVRHYMPDRALVCPKLKSRIDSTGRFCDTPAKSSSEKLAAIMRMCKNVAFRKRSWYAKQVERMDATVNERKILEDKLNCFWWKAVAFFPGLIPYVDSTVFEMWMAVPIMLNCISIGISANCGTRCSEKLRAEYGELPLDVVYETLEDVPIYKCMYPTNCSDTTFLLLNVTEKIFTTFFVFEWVVRVLVYGPRYFKDFANLFDTLLVWVTGVAVVYLLEPLDLEVDYVRQLQVLRACRLIRIARVVRMVPAFKEMWLMVRGLADSLNILLWSLIMIWMILYIFGIFALEIIGRAVWPDGQSMWWDDTNASHVVIRESFASLMGSMFSLIQCMTLDSWTALVRPINQTLQGSVVFFLLFIMIATFVLLNLVTAVIVNNAMETTGCQDEEMVARWLEHDRAVEGKQLDELFTYFDTDESNSVSWKEFSKAFDNPKLRDKLKLLDVEKNEMWGLFCLLDDDDGEGTLDIEEFKTGFSRLKGTATSKDMSKCVRDLLRVEKDLNVLMGRIDDDGRGLPNSKGQITEEDKRLAVVEDPNDNDATPPTVTKTKQKTAAPQSPVINADMLLVHVESSLRQVEERMMRSLNETMRAHAQYIAQSQPPQAKQAWGKLQESQPAQHDVVGDPQLFDDDQIDVLISKVEQMEQWMNRTNARLDDLHAAATAGNRLNYCFRADGSISIIPRHQENAFSVPTGSHHSPNYFPRHAAVSSTSPADAHSPSKRRREGRGRRQGTSPYHPHDGSSASKTTGGATGSDNRQPSTERARAAEQPPSEQSSQPQRYTGVIAPEIATSRSHERPTTATGARPMVSTTSWLQQQLQQYHGETAEHRGRTWPTRGDPRAAPPVPHTTAENVSRDGGTLE